MIITMILTRILYNDSNNENGVIKGDRRDF